VSISTDDHQYGGWEGAPGDYHLASDGKTWVLSSPASYDLADVARLTIQELEFDTDPIVYNNYLIQNLTGVNQIYTVTVSLPTTWAAPNLIRGSIDTSVIGTDATVSTVSPTPIYQAQIDGVTVETLQDHAFSLFTPNSATSSSASFGFQLNNVAVTTDIGIALKFQLTPGDTVAIISDFEIVEVPEPGTLSLGLLAGALLFLRRQRS
jgi:hypothetical protein